MERTVGIDLGTTNSVVAWVGPDERPEIIPNADGDGCTPSAVAFENDAILVGRLARSQAALNPERTIFSVKRHMGEEGYRVRVGNASYTPQEISALILRRLKADAEAYLGGEVQRAVVTVPAYFNATQRAATREAAEIAGLNLDRILDEPTAAAMSYKLHEQERLTILVFDFGGGTLDISVLKLNKGRFSVIATSGDNSLGGDDIDQRVMEMISRRFEEQHSINLLKRDPVTVQRLREAAEEAKRQLSFKDSARVSIPFIVPERALSLDMSLTRAELERAVADLFDRLRAPLIDALDYAKLKPTDIEEVLLSGGSTRIPRVRMMLAEMFGKQALSKVNPDECVALGAAVAASYGTTKVTFKASRSVGVEIAGGSFSAVIQRGATLPTVAVEPYTTAHDNQTAISFPIYQGEAPIAGRNLLLGEIVIDGIEPGPAGGAHIDVAFEMTTEGILKASASDVRTGKQVSVVIESAVMSEDEKRAATQRVAELASKIE